MDRVFFNSEWTKLSLAGRIRPISADRVIPRSRLGLDRVCVALSPARAALGRHTVNSVGPSSSARLGRDLQLGQAETLHLGRAASRSLLRDAIDHRCLGSSRYRHLPSSALSTESSPTESLPQAAPSHDATSRSSTDQDRQEASTNGQIKDKAKDMDKTGHAYPGQGKSWVQCL